MSPLGVVSVVQRGTSQRVILHRWFYMCVFLVLDIQPYVHGRMDGGVYLSNSRGTFFFLKKKELGSSLPDGVASPETNPLRDGTVLLLSFGKLLLGAERLVALFHI